MIIDIHEQSGRRAIFPGVIAKRLSKRMTADVLILHCFAGSSLYNTICLSPAYRLVSAGVLGKNKFMVIWITFIEIIFQSIGGIVV